MNTPTLKAYFEQPVPESDRVLNQEMASDLFVIWQEATGFRASKMVEGKIARYTTEYVELADHFRSEETARDHLFFTLAGQTPRDVMYSIKPLRLRQKIESTYIVGEANEYNRIRGEDL